SLQAGVAHTRVVKRVVHRHGKRRTVRRRVTELRPRGVIRLGRQTQISGRLANRDGQGIAGADVQVFANSEGATEQLVGDVRTDPSGRWALPYKFARTRGVQWYRFRVELPSEAGYPFGPGASKSLRVRVKGRS